MNWQCICGNYVMGKRFCPRCKIMRFSLSDAPVLDYWGIRMGRTKNGLPFNLPQNLLSTHVLVSGQTGSGKTRFAMNLVSKVERTKPHVLIIDVEGEWKRTIPLLKKETRYYSVDKNLRINPFDLNDPALIRELLRETVFKGIEKEYTDLSAQMNFVLQDTIKESSNMDELIQNIKSYGRQKLTALQKTKTALLVRLDPFLRSPLKEIFMCTKSNPDFANIDHRNTVIDLHALDALVAYSSELRLIYNVITVYFLRKMLSKDPDNVLTNLFVADEAQMLVPKILRKLIITESWPATEFATRLRKRGCGMVLITQSPGNIEQDIFKNTATKISFRLQHQDDIKLIAESIGFTDIVEKEFLSNHFVNLPNRDAIVCTYGHEPFVITSDELDLPNHDPELIEPTGPEPRHILSRDESVFLESIDNEPFLSVRQRRGRLNWNDRRYSSTVDSLLSKRMIEVQKAKLGRGAPIVLYQRPGKIPSVRHQFYVNWISEKLKDMNLKTVRNIRKGPDIEIPSMDCAIEVELGTSDVHSNISRNVTKHKTVIVTSDDRKLLESLSRENTAQNLLFLQIRDVPAFFEKMRKGKN